MKISVKFMDKDYWPICRFDFEDLNLSDISVLIPNIGETFIYQDEGKTYNVKNIIRSFDGICDTYTISVYLKEDY